MEVLLAWSLFAIAMASLAFVQLSVLKRLDRYTRQRMWQVQLHNLVRLHAYPNRIPSWVLQTKMVLHLDRVSWQCQRGQCCLMLPTEGQRCERLS